MMVTGPGVARAGTSRSVTDTCQPAAARAGPGRLGSRSVTDTCPKYFYIVVHELHMIT